ncbi:MAG: CHASE2 domain-containing protein [Treponema sp.]|nr:CHASE2 domain-containing protein [Treponema sp.]
MKKNSFFFKYIHFVVFLCVTLIGIGISATGAFEKIDCRFFDTLLRLSPKVAADDHIVFLDIEDRSIEEIGVWPWPRSIIGNFLIRLKEFGAYNIAFDVEYLSPSPASVDENMAQVTDNVFGEGEAVISQAVQDFGSAIATKDIGPSEAEQAAQLLVSNTIDPTLYTMYQTIADGINRNLDEDFGRAIQFFGNTYLTINTRDLQIPISETDDDYATNRFLWGNVSDSQGLIDKGNDYVAAMQKDAIRAFVPAIHDLMKYAQGASFTNVGLDVDGTRRRVELLNYHDGKYTGQLGFNPTVRMLDVESMERKKNSLVLHNALLPGSENRKDIEIPLDAHGRMFVNWQHATYENSFLHVPVCNFYFLDLDEAGIINALEDIVSLRDDNYVLATELLSYYAQTKQHLNELLRRCQGFDRDGVAIGGGLTEADYESYFGSRKEFFEAIESFIMQSESEADVYKSLTEQYTIYQEDFAAMHDVLAGAYCFLGNSATGSTDMGVTPFVNGYANLGTHGNVANTILQQDFITEYSTYWGVLFACLCIFIALLRFNSVSKAIQNLFGLMYIFIPTAVIVILMVTKRIYIPLTTPLFIVVVTYLSEFTYNFIMTEKDKNTLRRGFDAYVAPEVVGEIIKNPSLLGLGGVNKRITALFSDVKTFSGFTECVNQEEGESHGAVRLVEILNGYLGALSDAIMDNHGTIDKYVGDEIVSFFGAPIDNPDNAYDACVAAIRMKEAEDRYNEEHVQELPINPRTKTPFLLKSRVGLNTGDMVVGNMGTEKKLNYTIMGNNVNLASRLEGTNKAYDSWIMVSESTWNDANAGVHAGELVARQLDCVKVINVEKPVQIYSIAGLRKEMTAAQIESAELFNQGMDWYLRGREDPQGIKDVEDFRKAAAFFKKAYDCYHRLEEQDKNFISTERKMFERCKIYIDNGLPLDEKGKPVKWDGVYTMTSK